MNRKKRIIVTGGAGFIGSHLCERLIDEGFEVIVIDDLSTGNLKNLDNIKNATSLKVIVSKVSECSDLPIIVRDASFIIHLAAAVGVKLVVESPIRTIRTNLDETEAVLDAATERKVPVLIASTSEVYGKSPKEVFSEDDDLLIGPPYFARWSYACSKLMDEFLAMSYMREKKVPVIICRFFNTTGPRQVGTYGMVLPRFVDAALANNSLKIYGDGTQTRCFCHVKDTIEAIIRLTRCQSAIGEIVNVGSDREISIYDLAKLVIKLLNSKSSIEFVSYEAAYIAGFDDMLRRKPNISKLFKLTGFKPITLLEDIIIDIAKSKGARTGAF